MSRRSYRRQVATFLALIVALAIGAVCLAAPGGSGSYWQRSLNQDCTPGNNICWDWMAEGSYYDSCCIDDRTTPKHVSDCDSGFRHTHR